MYPTSEVSELNAGNWISTDYFLPAHIRLLERAVNVSEDIISDYFCLTTDYWLKNPYEVKTLKEAGSIDIPERAYAHVLKYGKLFSEKDSGTDNRHLYRILIYDNRILEVTEGRKTVLWPFLVYIMTHELTHIARFTKFKCAVELKDKLTEEKTVHGLTNEILDRAPVSGIEHVIDFFEGKQAETQLI